MNSLQSKTDALYYNPQITNSLEEHLSKRKIIGKHKSPITKEKVKKSSGSTSEKL